MIFHKTVSYSLRFIIPSLWIYFLLIIPALAQNSPCDYRLTEGIKTDVDKLNNMFNCLVENIELLQEDNKIQKAEIEQLKNELRIFKRIIDVSEVHAQRIVIKGASGEAVKIDSTNHGGRLVVKKANGSPAAIIAVETDRRGGVFRAWSLDNKKQVTVDAFQGIVKE